MSWLCDVCGYENEFNDESQPTTCLCCGEPAPESKIINARRELDAYHREEERKARLEELRRKQELRQQSVDRIVTRITRAVRAIPVAAVAMVIVAFVWVGISFHSEGMTMSAWNTKMHSNINAISLTGYSDNLKSNLADLGLTEKMLVPLEEAGQILTSQMMEHFSTISGNVTRKSEISSSDYSSNLEELDKSSARNNYLSENALIVLESVGSDLKQVGEQVPKIGQNITSSSSNMKLNWPIFWSHAKDNVQELVYYITKREGGAND